VTSTQAPHRDVPFSAAYESFVGEMDTLIRRSGTEHGPADAEAIRDALGGGAYRALRRLIDIDDLRASGAFFTSTAIAEGLWSDALQTLDADSIVVDPACGAGDLLLPAVVQLLATNGGDSVRGQVKGTDKESSFVEAARARLRLALMAGSKDSQGSGDFEHLRVADFLKNPESIVGDATHVVLNPPFATIRLDAELSWAAGSTNLAAVFVELCLQNMPEGARLLAILPEVLRSGTRYGRWREKVAAASSLNSLRELGQFDSATDIHVFALDLTKISGIPTSTSRASWWTQSDRDPEHGTVGDNFEVKVGAVVPHRHLEVGSEFGYVAARDLVAWSSVKKVAARRRFEGRVDSGPVVAIRRTSRPGELFRARGTIIEDVGPVAYENHLIVLRPRDGKVTTCERLLENLKDPRTTLFLDETIKLRHLTVSSVRDIPWHVEEPPSE
jgi:hypothetical protein